MPTEHKRKKLKSWRAKLPRSWPWCPTILLVARRPPAIYPEYDWPRAHHQISTLTRRPTPPRAPWSLPRKLSSPPYLAPPSPAPPDSPVSSADAVFVTFVSVLFSFNTWICLCKIYLFSERINDHCSISGLTRHKLYFGIFRLDYILINVNFFLKLSERGVTLVNRYFA